MDPVERRLTIAYSRALEQVQYMTRNNDPHVARAIVKAKQALTRLRRYQAGRN